MAKDFWINLPVKSIEKSKKFFSELGFTFNEKHGNTASSAAMLIGEKKTVVMLFDEPTFKGFTGQEINDSWVSSEVLLSIDVQSKAEVDEMIAKAIQAGGTSNHVPKEMQGWIYGSIFQDLDGHRWNIVYMDMNKIS